MKPHSQLDKYLPQKIRSEIEQRYYAKVNAQSRLEVVDTQLLRLDQEPFHELMDDRSEVARGIILVLSRHLRDRVQDLNELRARFEAAKISQ